MKNFYEEDVACEFSLLGVCLFFNIQIIVNPCCSRAGDRIAEVLESAEVSAYRFSPFNMASHIEQGPGPNEVGKSVRS